MATSLSQRLLPAGNSHICQLWAGHGLAKASGLAREVDSKAHAGEHYAVSSAAAATALADSTSVVKMWDGSQEAGGDDIEQLQAQAAGKAGNGS